MRKTEDRLISTDGVEYGVCRWPEDGFGNQRAVVRVDNQAGAVHAVLP